MIDALVRVSEETGVVALAESWVGERPVGDVSRVLVKRETGGTGPGIPWHQDAAFYGENIRALNVWTALTPCGDTCPGLSVIPRRFESVLDPGYKLGPPSEHMLSTVRDLLHETAEASPVFEPGDAILFDEMTLHRTSHRPWSAPFRDVAVTWFFAPSRFPARFVPLAI
jgi:Phytanoyl-CoA dioxygenase (PhyH)